MEVKLSSPLPSSCLVPFIVGDDDSAQQTPFSKISVPPPSLIVTEIVASF